VLAVTFTNKAANECVPGSALLAASRSIPSPAFPLSTPSACACCGATATRWPAPGRLHRRFTIYDEDDQLGIVRPLPRAGLDEKEFMHAEPRSHASATPRTARKPRDLLRDAVNPESERVAAVWQEYEKALHAANALDLTTCCSKPSAFSA